MGDVAGLICGLKRGEGGAKEGYSDERTFGTRTRNWTGSLAIESQEWKLLPKKPRSHHAQVSRSRGGPEGELWLVPH